MQKLPHSIIISPEIHLEKITTAHAPSLFAHIDRYREQLSDYVHWTRFTHTQIDSVHFAQRCEQESEKDISFVWTIFYRQQAVGTLSFNSPIEWENRTVYLGYWLSPEVQGNGIMTTAVNGLISVTQTYFDHYILRCAIHNQRSNKVAIRCGFQFEKILSQAEKIGEQWFDQNYYRKTIQP